MLEELHVRDLALIEEVWLELGPGMTVLTGETGAGKTVLVGALKLLVGERGDSTLVRAGADEALVEGRFARAGADVLVRRRLSAEGRSRCALGGEMASVGDLADRVGPLVDLHGQHEHQALLSPANHAGYLDRFVGEAAASAVGAYRVAFESHKAAAAELDALSAMLEDRDERAGYLRFQISEIDAVAPREGEDAELEAVLPALRHAGRLTEAAALAHRAVSEEGGAADRLAEARAALRVADGLDPALDALAAELERVAVAADEAAVLLREYGERVEHDPRALDEVESRLAALSLLKKKYGPALADVLDARGAAVATLEALDSGEDSLAEARAREATARSALETAGNELAALRLEAAGRFTAELSDAAADLALPGARFDVDFADLPMESWTMDGPQRVEFLFSSVSDGPTRPLARIASGGEVSRVMLALKSVLGRADSVPVLVFDEVDSGIGGVTALAVGRRLAELSRDHQVLVVTHLAQVAVFADRQIVVRKEDASGSARTAVTVVEGEERIAEIARMLAGSDSEAGLAHARELMATAAGTA